MRKGESAVPYVNIRITEDGATSGQKSELISRVTQALVEVLGKNATTCHVVIDEVRVENWGWGGESVAERRRRAVDGG